MHAYACICMQCVLLITSYGNYNIIYCPYIAEANSQWGGREAEGTDVYLISIGLTACVYMHVMCAILTSYGN